MAALTCHCKQRGFTEEHLFSNNSPRGSFLNILDTTPTPTKNGSYGIKVGFRMP